MTNGINIKKQQITRFINMISFLILMTGLILLTIIGKHTLYPYSKTWWVYLQWVGNYVSLVSGYIALPLLIIYFIPKALRIGRAEKPEPFAFYNKLLKILDNKIASYILLGILLALMIILASRPRLWTVRTIPPPIPGKLVISNFPGSDLYFLVKENQNESGVEIYSRKNSSPIQSYFFPKRSANDNSWQSNIESIAVSHDENLIYVLDSKKGAVFIMGNDSLRRLNVLGRLPVDQTAKALALDADGKKLYVAVSGHSDVQMQGEIFVFDVSGNTINQLPSIKNVGHPESLFIVEESSNLLVTSQGGLDNDVLYIIDTSTDEVTNAISGFEVISKAIASRNGKAAFVKTTGGLFIVRNYIDETIQKIFIPNKSIPVHVSIPDSLHFGNGEAFISTMALTPDESTLIVGILVQGDLHYKDKIQKVSFGQILSIDIKSGNFCEKKPFDTEFYPKDISIANDGTLYAPLVDDNQNFIGIKIGDSAALKCEDKNYPKP